MAGNRSPANGNEAGCQYYYSKLLKKNIYTTLEIEPEFPGGSAAYVRFLNKNLRISVDTLVDVTSLPMPKMKFIVETYGQIIAPCIDGKNDTTQLNALEKDALEFIKKMPKWVPGMCGGKVVAAEVNRPLAICIKWETE
ncbi:hypothetical protein [Niastella vici]|nr:hypothetical protein [Niastella vici]